MCVCACARACVRAQKQIVTHKSLFWCYTNIVSNAGDRYRQTNKNKEQQQTKREGSVLIQNIYLSNYLSIYLSRERETERDRERQRDRERDRDRMYNNSPSMSWIENVYSKFSPIVGLFQGLPGRLG